MTHTDTDLNRPVDDWRRIKELEKQVAKRGLDLDRACALLERATSEHTPAALVHDINKFLEANSWKPMRAHFLPAGRDQEEEEKVKQPNFKKMEDHIKKGLDNIAMLRRIRADVENLRVDGKTLNAIQLLILAECDRIGLNQGGTGLASANRFLPIEGVIDHLEKQVERWRTSHTNQVAAKRRTHAHNRRLHEENRRLRQAIHEVFGDEGVARLDAHMNPLPF